VLRCPLHPLHRPLQLVLKSAVAGKLPANFGHERTGGGRLAPHPQDLGAAHGGSVTPPRPRDLAVLSGPVLPPVHVWQRSHANAVLFNHRKMSRPIGARPDSGNDHTRDVT